MKGSNQSRAPLNRELTTQDAADILCVSRPFLIKLLDHGNMPYRKTGTHRRIKLHDLLAYRERRDRNALSGLSALAADAQEAGDYFG